MCIHVRQSHKGVSSFELAMGYCHSVKGCSHYRELLTEAFNYFYTDVFLMKAGCHSMTCQYILSTKLNLHVCPDSMSVWAAAMNVFPRAIFSHCYANVWAV